MAESGAATQTSSNGSDTRKTALRAAAIAAASGATAIAAKRAFSGGSGSGSSRSSNGNGNGAQGDSLVTGMLSSGWSAAKDALVPFAEDAAKAGGEYLAENGPDVVRETIVPAFIDGFQGAGGKKKSSADDDED